MTDQPSLSDILALLKEDWLPEEQKAALKKIIIDTIKFTEEAMRKMRGDWT